MVNRPPSSFQLEEQQANQMDEVASQANEACMDQPLAITQRSLTRQNSG